MSRLNIAAPAEAEFLDAVAWYRQRDPRVAERFITETRNALHLIETFPQIGGRVPEIDDPDVRRMPIHTFPYSIVFVRVGDRLEVVAFAHNRRHPRYFLNRLRR